MFLGIDPRDSALYGVVLWPIVYWDYGFESHGGHEYLSLVIVASCQVAVNATG
jgi:hypothetical protein